jgi:ribosomal protein S18 acetylase RimI-like enzyme
VVAIEHALPDDAPAILALQKLAYLSEAALYNDWSIPPLTQTIESLIEEFSVAAILKASIGSRLVGSVRARANGDTCEIGRLVVQPEFQRQGIGSSLLTTIESMYPGVGRFELFTGSKSEDNIRLYQRAGYRLTRTQALSPAVSITYLEKLPTIPQATQSPRD